MAGVISASRQKTVTSFPVDQEIYNKIKLILINTYPDDQEKVNCMDKYFRRNKVADDFYTPDLMNNGAALSKAIDPYVKKAEESCNKNSNIGVIVGGIIAFFLIGGIFIFCLVLCCCPCGCCACFLCCCCAVQNQNNNNSTVVVQQNYQQ